MFPVVYALRDRMTDEWLKFGSAGVFRNRIFGHYIGGCNVDATTNRLYDCETIRQVEIAWIETNDEAEARLKEREFREAYKDAHHGRRPIWDLRD